MRSNLTASMFDLSMKDKSRNPLGKLKDKLKGKRGSGLPDTASAIIPSISHSPAGSDEESNEKEKKKSKFKTLFSKPGLQKSNVSQSMSVLPTLQPVTEKVRLRPSDFSSQWGDDDDDDDTLTPVSEKPSANRADNNSLYPPSGMSHKRTGSSDSKQLNQIASSSKKDTLSLFGGLKPKNDPASRSNVCINGSHVYVEHSDALSKDSTPSSPSPLTPRQKRLFLSQENLSSETAKEPEVTGQLPAGKGPPESSSLESFKAMTLPSYKLLSGDFLESSTPVTPITLDISKETKENKKQENKKSGLLSLVTGKKEAKVSEETESGADTPLKLKEVKREEKESARKETNPFEVPGEGKRDRGPDKSSAASVPTAKTSSNRFDDVVVGEEKQEKSTAPVKPSQTKPVKPRVGVSSEDETKAALTISEPSCVSPFHPSHLSSNDHNPFTSNLGPEVKALGSDSFRGPSLNLSSPHDNNPFIVKWEQESKVQDSEFFSASPLASGKENNPFSPNWKQESQIENSGSSTKSLLYLPHPPTPVLESHPLPSQLSNVDNPFESKQKEESEHINNPPTPVTFPPPASSQEHDSSAGSLIDSKKCPVIPLEEPQNEGLTNQGPISSLSGSHPEHFCDPVGLLPKMQHDNKDVNIVTPLKENNGSMKKKSVTFAVVESQDHPVSSGDEMSDEDSIERWHDENENVEVSTERNVELELEPEHCSVSRSYDGTISSAANNEGPLEKQAETNSPVKTDPPVPIPRVLMLSPKETGLSGTELNGNSLSVPPKPAPRSTLKQDKCVSPPLTDTAEKDARNSASELGLVVDNSETLANNSSLPTSVLTELHPGQDGGAVESSESSNRDLSVCGISTRSAVLITGDLNLKPATLPVIPEVGSDDEQLSDTQKGVKKTGICEDLSRTSDRSSELWSLVEGRELASNKKATGKQTYSLLARMTDLDDESLESNKALINTLTAGLQNVSRSIGESEPKGEIQEGRQSDCSEASDSPASLSSLSSSALPLVPTSPFQSETLGSDRAEPPKKTAAEGLDAKVEISGKKRLLQAWVSPSEIQPSQALQSGGTQPAKLRLHPVKPMNATTNKPSEKTLNVAKILDSRNEANLKKYNPSDPAYAYAQLTHDELIQLVLKQKEAIAKRDLQVRELEDYIDDLLVRVMEETPNILRVQNRATKKAGKM
ncbi:rab11 family-interacting protein 1 isoform X2 [Tiliqua scincoides]